MPIKFQPKFAITAKIASLLLRIESVKEKIRHLPLTPHVLASLRETARLYTTHYSTMIEGNRLTPNEVEEVLKHAGHFPGRERDESEVKGYYLALNQVEKWAAKQISVSEKMIQTMHALVMGKGRSVVKATSYRDGQNVIREGHKGRIVYLPPEAKEVPDLMAGMVNWVGQKSDLPCPIVAAIAHYQFATIHPYYDGNGRTARLLTTLILHLGGYDLKGLYSLEEYYAQRLSDYYQAISIGPTYNYYDGRAESDITSWVEYFIEGMALAFENVLKQMKIVEKEDDKSPALRQLDPKQRKVLTLFEKFETVTAAQIGKLFHFKPRTSSELCKKWVEASFLEIVDPSRKGRTYRLAKSVQRNRN